MKVAKLFFSTHAEEKLRNVRYQASVVVRCAIEELGGTMPEDLPNVESIKKLETTEKKRLALPKKKSTDEAS
jgi:DNA-damage-inducible protein D